MHTAEEITSYVNIVMAQLIEIESSEVNLIYFYFSPPF